MGIEEKKEMINKEDKELSVRKQCKILNINRTGLYYKSKKEKKEKKDNEIRNKIDEIFTKCPFYGIRRITNELKKQGEKINKKRVRRLMRLMNLVTFYPKPNLSKVNKMHKKYPYLLRNVKIDRNNQVWATDITYVKMEKGFGYLTVVMDWNSRYILSWELSNTLETSFCINCLDNALKINKPEIFNSDQGSQYTSDAFTGRLLEEGIKISMDGKGRAFDNIFVERFWRTIKYEEIYPKAYESLLEARQNIAKYIEFYNNKRPHQSLGYKTPAEIYFNENNVAA